MYLEVYGLKEKPFRLSPDPKYLYCGSSHKEALSQMVYAVTQDCGLMALVGEVGTGKTLLVNSLVDSLPEGYLCAKIHYTILDPKGLIQNICKEFRIAFADRSMGEMLLNLQDFLKWRYEGGKKTVLILDEAQNLSRESFETIRLLSNVGSEQEKYLQILLVGQQELESILQRDDLRQLRERIELRFRLSALNQEETGRYIDHRLTVAGCESNGKLFSREAIQRIHAYSKGIPRRINILCDCALLFGYAINASQIDKRMVEQIARDHVVTDNQDLDSSREIDNPLPKYHDPVKKPFGEMKSVRRPIGIDTGGRAKGPVQIPTAPNNSRHIQIKNKKRSYKLTRIVSNETILWSIMILIWSVSAVYIVIRFGIPFVQEHTPFLESIYGTVCEKTSMVLNYF